MTASGIVVLAKSRTVPAKQLRKVNESSPFKASPKAGPAGKGVCLLYLLEVSRSGDRSLKPRKNPKNAVGANAIQTGIDMSRPLPLERLLQLARAAADCAPIS